jgi:uncharacterized protein (UPF0128 family)
MKKDALWLSRWLENQADVTGEPELEEAASMLRKLYFEHEEMLDVIRHIHAAGQLDEFSKDVLDTIMLEITS